MSNRRIVLEALAVYERRLDDLFDALEKRAHGTLSHEDLMNTISKASSAREALHQARAECEQW